MPETTEVGADHARSVRRVAVADLEPWQQDLLRESRAQSEFEREFADQARAAAAGEE